MDDGELLKRGDAYERKALFLPAFCGTLVSDFYSVYAKMDCKKQNACLPSCGRPLSG